MLIRIYISNLIRSAGKILAIPITILLGMIAIVVAACCCYCAWWILFPGLWRFGGFVGNDLLGLDMPDLLHSDLPYRWLFSVLVIAFLPVSYIVGRKVWNKLFS